MKKIKNISAIIICMALFVSSCNEAAKKDMNDASNNMKEANTDIKEAITATNDTAKASTIAHWRTFKTSADSAIADMEKETNALGEKIAKANNSEKEKLQTELDNSKTKLQAIKLKLQQSDTDFNNDIKSFDASVISKNKSFEREFTHDMNELGTAFKDLFKNNAK
jgi:hypothetical protein